MISHNVVRSAAPSLPPSSLIPRMRPQLRWPLIRRSLRIARSNLCRHVRVNSRRQYRIHTPDAMGKLDRYLQPSRSLHSLVPERLMSCERPFPPRPPLRPRLQPAPTAAFLEYPD